MKRGTVIHGSGKIIREFKTLKPSKQMCRGCYDDVYNHGCGGASECWAFKGSKVVTKIGYRSIHSTKMDTKISRTLSCWHGVNK